MKKIDQTVLKYNEIEQVWCTMATMAILKILYQN